MNNHLNPIFRTALAAFAPKEPSRECPECHTYYETRGHSNRCSLYIPPSPIPWAADGFVRDASGHIAGFAVANAVTPEGVSDEKRALVEQEREERLARLIDRQRRPAYAEIGNGLFVRVGTGRKRRAA